MADPSFQKEFLEAHNAYRKKHGAPPLSLNTSLSQSAQAWAEKLLASRTLKHSNTDYGENLYYTSSSKPQKPSGSMAVDTWYDEIKKYDFNRPGFTSGTGHFTQVVWKDSKELGVGLATDGTTVFVVGQYNPAGNITNAGYYEKNVLPTGSSVDPKEPNTAPGRVDLSKPTAPTVDSASSTIDPSFQKEFLEAHNAYRKKHGAPPLSLNTSLSQSAQAWAEKLLASRTLKHSNGDYGENLFYASSSKPQKPSGSKAVDTWYDEIKKYDFNKPGFTSGTGHFTQVVWKDSKELGVGVATDGTTVFVVGQYNPAGNITNAGYYEKNVLPPGSSVDPKEPNTAPGTVDLSKPAAPTVDSASSTIDPSFQKEFLEAHNAYRKKHGAPPLSLNTSLSQSAQAWAEKLLASRTLKHSNGDYGENLYYTSSSKPQKPSGSKAVDTWYDEIKKYDFNRPGFTSGTGHFTQVVWKGSKELGVGVATDGTTVFVVGQYNPAGNITNAGYYEKNVLPPGSSVDPKEPNTAPGTVDLSKPTAPTVDSASSTIDPSFQKEFLEAHNAYRKKHGAPPLSLNTSLSQSAQAWAEKLLASRTLKHSNGDYGENLYYASSSKPQKSSGSKAVDTWYDEIKKYDFNRPGFTSGTGHFTQVVWKGSKELGVGVATDGTTVFVVGQYNPAGNITNAGYYEKNVLPPGSSVDPKEPNTAPGTVDLSKPTAPTVDSASSTIDPSFQKEFLESHNAYRKKHGAPPLSLNTSLSQSAQAWAEKLLASRTLKHSNTDYGENLYYTSSSKPQKPSGSKAVDSWYDEIKKYDFNKPGFTSGTGHFTQVVWKDSKELGVGVATDGTTVFVVGQYNPAGNITNAGYFEKNVLPPGSSVDPK